MLRCIADADAWLSLGKEPNESLAWKGFRGLKTAIVRTSLPPFVGTVSLPRIWVNLTGRPCCHPLVSRALSVNEAVKRKDDCHRCTCLCRAAVDVLTFYNHIILRMSHQSKLSVVHGADFLASTCRIRDNYSTHRAFRLNSNPALSYSPFTTRTSLGHKTTIFYHNTNFVVHTYSKAGSSRNNWS